MLLLSQLFVLDFQHLLYIHQLLHDSVVQLNRLLRLLLKYTVRDELNNCPLDPFLPGEQLQSVKTHLLIVYRDFPL